MVSQSPLSMRSLHTGLPATLSSGSTTSSSSPRQPQTAEPPSGHNGHYPGPELPATNGHHQEPAPAPALPSTGLSSLPSYSPVYNNNNNNVNNINNSPAARHYRSRHL